MSNKISELKKTSNLTALLVPFASVKLCHLLVVQCRAVQVKWCGTFLCKEMRLFRDLTYVRLEINMLVDSIVKCIGNRFLRFMMNCVYFIIS